MFIIGQILLFILLIIQIVIVVVLILIFVSNFVSFAHGAPYVPVRKKLTRDILLFGGLSARDVFYDLGSGDGRVLITAVKDFRAKKAVGYEVALWPYLKSKFLIRRAGLKNIIAVNRKNFFKVNLSPATFIYIYLFPRIMNRLAGKVAEECRSGIKVLCPSFPIDVNKHEELKLIKAGNFGKMTAYLYQKI